jgi:hypothetical protein
MSNFYEKMAAVLSNGIGYKVTVVTDDNFCYFNIGSDKGQASLPKVEAEKLINQVGEHGAIDTLAPMIIENFNDLAKKNVS